MVFPTTDGPLLTDPAVEKDPRMSPVKAFIAYMCPVFEPPKTTVPATVTAPVRTAKGLSGSPTSAASGSAVVQRISPVPASSAAQAPPSSRR